VDQPTPDVRPAELVRIRGMVARLLCEPSIDTWQALECDLAEILGIEPGDDPFTWRWEDHVGDGLEDDGMGGAP
jgi:hypothetical protein